MRFKTNLNIMDNEASKSLKLYIITTHNSKYQLEEPHNHCVKAAEKVIQTFKYYFVAGMCVNDKYLPVILWYALL